MNGSTDHNVIESLSDSSSFLLNSSNDSDTTDNKPKLREWEKHRAPWLEEMKLNQAKRTSTGPEPKAKLTPTEKTTVSEVDGFMKPIMEKETSPIEKPKSISGIRLKTPPNESSSIIRNKTVVPMPIRPQTIHNISDGYLPKQATKGIKPPSPKVETDGPVVAVEPREESIMLKPQLDFEQRIAKLEELVQKQQKTFEAAIDELRGKLQIETELRMKFQVKLERLSESDAIQEL